MGLVSAPCFGGLDGVSGAVHGDDGGLLESAFGGEVYDFRDDGGLGVFDPVFPEVAFRLNAVGAGGFGVDGD